MTVANDTTAGAALERLLAKNLDKDDPVFDVVAVSDAIEELMQTLGKEVISEPVAAAVRSGRLSLTAGHTVLGVAAWSGSENGESLQRTLEEWLCNPKDEIDVGLALDQGVYPFIDPSECYATLEKVGLRFPRYRARCMEICESRKR